MESKEGQITISEMRRRGLRTTRAQEVNNLMRGTSDPVGSPGLLASGTPPLLRAPIILVLAALRVSMLTCFTKESI